MTLVTYFEESVTATQSYKEGESKMIFRKECRNIAQMCRGGGVTDKVQLKLKLAGNLKGSRRG